MDIKRIRKDFPIFERKINGKPIIYFDSACTTLKPKQVVEAMNEYYYSYPACAGRAVHKLSTGLTTKIDEVREKVANFISSNDSNEIIFTKNTTEGVNLLARSMGLRKGDLVITTDREHNSNFVPWLYLKEKIGIEHIIIPTQDEKFMYEEYEKALSGNKKKLKLVSMAHKSNLDGYIIPDDIIKIAHENEALVLLDCAQSIAHKKIDLKRLEPDFIVFSGHKMLGPTGIGVLYGRYELLEKMEPFILGGDTFEKTTYSSYSLLPPPKKFEAGNQNYAGIIGLGAAIDYLRKLGDIEKYVNELTNLIVKGMSEIDGLEFVGFKGYGGIINFNAKNIDSHNLAIILDEEENIMVRSGMHCVHSWYFSRKIPGSVRATIYIYNTKEEARIFLDTIEKIIKKLRSTK
ncbi:MAG: aminotransferase class V-fold PLP-dependent enzyme [Candidatus Thermoplasmatota archaeon]